MSSSNREFTPAEIDRILMMAWEDRTSFDAIEEQFGLTTGEVIKLMRREMKASSFKMWRKRTAGRKTKHEGQFRRLKTAISHVDSVRSGREVDREG